MVLANRRVSNAASANATLVLSLKNCKEGFKMGSSVEKEVQKPFLGGRFGYFLFVSVPGPGEREEESEEVAGGASFL